MSCINTSKLEIKKLKENAHIPTYGTEYAAGADLYAAIDENIVLMPGETKLIPTGLSMAIPTGMVGLIYARSGISIKRGLAPANKVGVIDSDYRGEVMVALYNQSNVEQVIEQDERIAQFVLMPYVQADFTEVEELDNDTPRGSGAFGSTGAK